MCSACRKQGWGPPLPEEPHTPETAVVAAFLQPVRGAGEGPKEEYSRDQNVTEQAREKW